MGPERAVRVHNVKELPCTLIFYLEGLEDLVVRLLSNANKVVGESLSVECIKVEDIWFYHSFVVVSDYNGKGLPLFVGAATKIKPMRYIWYNQDTDYAYVRREYRTGNVNILTLPIVIVKSIPKFVFNPNIEEMRRNLVVRKTKDES